MHWESFTSFLPGNGSWDDNRKIGKYIAGKHDAIGEDKYGSKIVATLSRQLTWSHFIELAEVSAPHQTPLLSADVYPLSLDLLFYHRRHHRLLAIDLKLGKFKPEYKGQMELLMLDEQNIKVAQYLTVLPEKQWFIDKMNRSIAIARELQDRKETE